MAVRRYQLPLASTTIPVRLSDVYGSGVGVVDAAADIPYRELTFVASAGALIGGLPPPPPPSGPAPSYADYQARVAADGAISYWPLSETSGLTAADKKGVRPGTISGGVTLGVAGITPGTTGMAFDGTGLIQAAPLPQLPPAFTQEVWLWLSAVPSAATKIVAFGRDAFGEVPTSLDVFPSGSEATLRFIIWGSPQFSIAGLPPGLALSSWHHIVVTHDGVTGRLYRDGVLENSTPSTLPPDSTFGSPLTSIGGMVNDPVSQWKGRLQDVAVYPTALSPTQIADHYTMRRAVAAPSASTLATSYQSRILADGAIAYWPLDDAAAPVRDLAGARPGVEFTAGGMAPLYQQTGVGGAASVQLQGRGFDIPPLPTLLPQFTYEAWIKITGTTTNSTILSRLGVCQWWIIPPNPTGRRVLQVFLGTSYGLQTPADNLIVLGTWYHVAVTHDGTTGRLYINGLPDTATLAFPLPPGDSAAFASSLGYNLNSGNTFLGGLQDVAVYPTALPAQTIADHYAARLGPSFPLVGVAAPFTLGPFDTGPLKLSHLYATGASGTLTILGVPY